ncbi:TonB-dependent receptor [Sphingosinicella microcystinivorans]|nr:TonB-dependent receptor [Sphingosinicella microcystinivorans]BBE33285.1 TonB-dependent receptor [Sphingosinicella microcystinivorans]
MAPADQELKQSVIVVTAQKREELLTEVPVAVSAFSGEDLDDRGISAFDALATVTPGLFLTTSESVRASRINIRGITSTPTTPGFEPGITINIDGVSQGRATTVNNEFLDIETIEVLRGPQNTLYGRSSVAGVINITTKKPVIGELGGDVSLSYSNYDEILTRGVLNVPLGDKAALRLGAYYKDREGFLENTLLGVKHNNIDRYGVRGSLLIDPGGDFELILRGSYTEDESVGNTYEPVSPAGNEGAIDRRIAQDFRDEQTRETYDFSATFEGEIGSGYTLTSITSFSGFDFYAANDQDRSPADFLVSGITEKQDQFSHEVRLTSPGDAPFRWIVGLYYFDQKVEPDAFAAFGTAFPVAPFRGVRATAYRAQIDVKEYAIFGQGDFDLSDGLTLTAGLRYGRTEKDILYDQRNPFVPTFVAETSLDDNALTGTVKLAYEIAPDSIIYASYSRGEKSGGFNAPGDLNVTAPISSLTDEQVRRLLSVAPEKVDSYEAGLRGLFLDNRLTVTLTGFYAEYRDRQVFELDFSGIIPSNRSLNRNTEAFGAELEARLSATDFLDIGGSYGFLDTTVKSNTGNPVTDNTFDGNDAERSPRHQVTLFAESNVPVTDDLEARLRADFSHISSWYDEDNNLPAAQADAHTLVNFRAGLSSRGGGWTISGYVDNIFDETYVTDFLNNGAAVAPNLGRRYGVRVDFTF